MLNFDVKSTGVLNRINIFNAMSKLIKLQKS